MFEKPIDFANAINSLCPGAQWKMENNDIENIEWFSDDIEMPSADQIIAEKERLELIQLEEKNNQEILRQSAIEKLSKLGLTQEEAKAIIGI